MPNTDPSREFKSQAALGTRLDCWKEIAAYLGRSERTVKRWEADRGLPIHRVPGGGRSSVYAFTAKLDTWLSKSEEADAESIASTASNAHPGPARDSAASKVAAPDAADTIPEQTPFTDAAEDLSPTPAVLPSLFSPSTLIATARNSALSWLALVLLLAVVLGALIGLGSHSAVLHASSPSSPLSAGYPAPASVSRQAVNESEKSLARELYLEGRYEWNQRTPDSLNRALDNFTQSLVHDPGYAEAYVGLADTYDLLREYTTMPEGEAFSRATVAARRAIALDDSLAEAHRALGFAEMYGDWDFRDAKKEFKRAIELNPTDPVARRWYANAFAVRGQFNESLEQIDKAQQLDPTSNSTLADKGIMLFNAGRAQEGIRILKEVERTAPEFRSPHYYLMRIGFETRDYPTYLREGKKTAELTNDPVLKDVMSAAQAGYAEGGEQALLARVYARQRHFVQSGKLWATTLADTCIHMGKSEEALSLLETAYAHHEEYLITSVLSHPDFLVLQNESKYQLLIKKINFPTS